MLDEFTDAHFTLFKPVDTPTRRREHPRSPSYSPDLSWWLGTRTVTWDREPYCCGSDHYPICLGLAPDIKRPKRRQCSVTDWDLFRKTLNTSVCEETSDPLRVLCTGSRARGHPYV